MNDKDLFNLIELVYAASLDRERWSDFLIEFSRLFRGNAGLFSQNSSNNEVGLVEYGGGDPAFAANYAQYYANVNPWYPQIWPTPGSSPTREGELLVGARLVDPSALERGEFYADWLRPQGLYEMIATPLIVSGTEATCVTVLRPRRFAELERDETSGWNIIMPHIRRAVKVHQELALARFRHDGTFSAFDHLQIGVILTNGEGRVILANRVGEDILSSGRTLMVRFDHIVGLTASATQDLLRLIRQAALAGGGKSLVAGGNLSLRSQDGSPVRISVTPVPADHRQIGVPSAPTAMLIIEDPNSKPQKTGKEVADRFGLTHAQARLFEALIQGKRLSEYADESELSLNTVKTHLKQIFAKTGETRQTDLLRLALGGAGQRN